MNQSKYESNNEIRFLNERVSDADIYLVVVVVLVILFNRFQKKFYFINMSFQNIYCFKIQMQ